MPTDEESFWQSYIKANLKPDAALRARIMSVHNIREIEELLHEAFDEDDDRIIDWETGQVYPKDET